MLMNGINIEKSRKKAKTKNPPYVANPNAMGGTRMKVRLSDYGVLQERFSHDWMRDLIRSLLFRQASESMFVVCLVYFFSLYLRLKV